MAEFDVNFVPSYIPSAGLQPPNPLQPGRADAALGSALAISAPPARSASVFFSPSKNAFLIGGREVSARDEAGILEASRQMDPNAAFPAPEGDWKPKDTNSFVAFVDKIANPDLGRRFSKNFESATAGMGALAGAGLRFAGAEDVGQGLMDVSNRRIQELSPYEMGLEDIDGSRSRGVTDWFAGIVGQFGPSIVETLVTAAMGAAAGAAAGGGPNPFTAVGGALTALSGKEAVKQALLAAAKKKLAGEAVDATEEKLLQEGASLFAAAAERNPGFAQNIIYGNVPASQFGQQASRQGAVELLKRGRNQAIAGGAGAFSAANSYAMGVSDVYREGLESGSPDRATAAALGIPYAALDLLPEFLLARRIFGDIGAAAGGKLADQAGLRAKAGELLKRGGKGFAAGAALEGSTEAGQEALLIAANPLVDWNSPEAISRLLNSFAAGAAIGGPIGSLANLSDNKQPANLLKPNASVDPDSAAGGGDTQQGGPLPGAAPTGPSNLPVAPSTPSGGQNIPYADYTEAQPSNMLAQPSLGLPAPPQQQLNAPYVPDRAARLRSLGMQQGEAPMQSAPPSDPRVPAFLAERQRRIQQAQQMAEQQAMSQHASLVQQQRPQAGPDLSGIPMLGAAPEQQVPASVQQASNPILAAQQFTQGAVAGADATADVAKFKVGAKLKLRKMTVAQANRAADFQQWLGMNRADPAFLAEVAEAVQRGDYAQVKQMMEELGFDPNTPKPTKAKTAKPLKTEAKAKTAKAPKGEALKTEKMRARPAPADEGSKPQASPERRENAAKAEAPTQPREAPKSSGRSKQALEDERDLRAAIDEVDTGTVSAMSDVFYYAYPEKDENIDPAVTQAAKDYLERTTFSSEQRKYLDTFLRAKGKEPSAKPRAGAATSTDRTTSLEKLMTFLDTLVRDPEALADRVKRMIATGKAAALYRDAVAATPGGERAVRSAPFNSKTVGDYFEVDRSGREIKPRLSIQLDVEEDTYSLADATDAKSGNFFRIDGAPMAPLNLGKIRLLVNSFINGLHVKPKVHVYQNVQDLKARNRGLFDRANKARKQGDFETTEAIGYAFDDSIIIFSDFVRTEQQLKFVLAHEAIGHFGLRAVVPGAELNTLLDSIYAKDRRVRAYVDRLIELGQDKREAIEEFLADYAAELDTSLVARIWAVIKSALNKLGLQFDDDLSRLIIGQSRMYVRTGNGGFFNARTLASMMNDMQEDVEVGRFSRVLDAQELGSQFAGMAELASRVLRPYEDIREIFQSKELRALGGSKAGSFARLAGIALETVQTLNNKATRSEGLSQVFKLFQGQGRKARQLLSHYNQILRETFKVGTTAEHKQKAGKLLAYGALYKNAKLNRNDLDALGALIKAGEFGESIEVNEELFKRLETMGMVTREEFINGFEFPDAMGGVQSFKLDTVKMTEADLAEDGPIWKIYVEQRKAINRAALDLLLANFEAAAFEQKVVLGKLEKTRVVREFTREDREALRDIIKRYRAVSMEGASVEGAIVTPKQDSLDKADEFLKWVTRAFDNDAVLQSWLDKNAVVDDANRVSDEFRNEFKDIASTLRSLNAKGWTENQRYAVQQQVRSLSLLQRQTQDAERLAKRTILSSYAPFKRRGKHQVRLAAYNEQGNLVRLSDSIRGVLPYFRDDDEYVVNQYVRELDTAFGGKLFELPDTDGNKIKVTLKAEASAAKQSPDFEGAVNMNEFVYMLQKFDINITPQSRERIVTALTEQNERARSNLLRSGTPGWDADMIRGTSEYLEMMSHVSAKRIYRARIDDVMQRDALWVAQDQKLREMKAAYENEDDNYKKARAKREYEQYAYMYRYMKAKGHTVEINGKTYQTLGQGERYREDAKALLHWYTDQTNINDSTEDFLQGDLASRFKTAVVFAQLGGTVATAAVNVVSMLTHTIPNAAFYNPNVGAGGGYGLGKASRQVWAALNDVKSFRLGDIDVLYEIREAKAWAKYNLTEDELNFLIEQTESGPLQAVLPDALLGSARGKITSPKVQKAAQVWMSMFSYTEKLNRRVTALATYRMEKVRSRAEGLTEQQSIDSATRAALLAVDDTQGEYSMFNRPKMARGNILSYVFMYKMFPILTVQLLRRLPMKGKLGMLALLLLLSGLKGLPFADDILDLLDTLLQKLGIKIGSVEAELYEMFDSIIPGSGNIFMRGGLDYWTGATISTRTGMGDLIPLTGALKAGADPWREAQQFLGPMAGGLFGAVNSFGAMVSLGTDFLGGRPSNTNLIEIARQSPIALARALGDAWVYADNGAVVNSQGRVVTSDAGPLILLWRALGFYPAEATRTNDLVRVSKASRDYQLEVSKAFKDAYVKATLSGDKAGAAAVKQQVMEWNVDAAGTGLEINNFTDSVNRAIKEARLPAGARFLKTTPLSMRDRTAEWMRLYGVDAR